MDVEPTPRRFHFGIRTALSAGIVLAWLWANAFQKVSSNTRMLGWPSEVARLYSDSPPWWWWDQDYLGHALTDIVLLLVMLVTVNCLARRCRAAAIEGPKLSRRWKIIVLLMAAGILIWLHSQPVISSTDYDEDNSPTTYLYGWPLIAFVTHSPSYDGKREPASILYGEAVIDGILSACFLFAALPVFEWARRVYSRIQWRKGLFWVGRFLLRLIPRFSLRTLLLAFLACGGIPLLYQHRLPWRILWQTSGHSIDPRDARFSLNGTQVLTLEKDGKIVVWDSSTGGKMFELATDTYSVFHPTYTPTGNAILTQNKDDGLMRIWSAQDGKLLKQFPSKKNLSVELAAAETVVVFDPWGNGPLELRDISTGCVRLSSNVSSFSVSDDGEKLAGVAESGRIKVWEIRSGNVVANIGLERHKFRFVRFTPSGKRIVVIEEGDDISTWDVSTGKLISIAHAQSSRPAWLVAEDRRSINDRTFAALALSGNQNQVFDEDTGDLLWSTDQGTMVFSADSTRVVITERGGGNIWSAMGTSIRDGRTGQVFQSLDLDEDKRHCIASEFSPHEERILTAHADGTLVMWYRHHPEYWWGIAWLPEFWLTVLFAGALVWSVWRDRKRIP